MHLALTGLFSAKWSAAVHEEWIHALLRRRPDLAREKLARTRMLMDLHAGDALVSGYEDLIESLQLPDPNDRHVLAAAIRGGADVIVTANLRHFPTDTLGNLGLSDNTRTCSLCVCWIWLRNWWPRRLAIIVKL